ncbi:hypothetical protein GCM10020254_74380 [Streptomyces goshikiensis]
MSRSAGVGPDLLRSGWTRSGWDMHPPWAGTVRDPWWAIPYPPRLPLARPPKQTGSGENGPFPRRRG